MYTDSTSYDCTKPLNLNNLEHNQVSRACGVHTYTVGPKSRVGVKVFYEWGPTPQTLFRPSFVLFEVLFLDVIAASDTTSNGSPNKGLNFHLWGSGP